MQWIQDVLFYVSPPWSFRKVAIDAAALFGTIILSVIVRTDWVAEFRAVPGRVGLAWQRHRLDLLVGLTFTPVGVLIGWYAWRHVYQLHEINPAWSLPIGLLSSIMTLTAAGWVLKAGLAILFSPFGEDPPPAANMEQVHQQKAYGDARAANAYEVDAALRGGNTGPQREFVD
jgi:hypothetical protein